MALSKSLPKPPVQSTPPPELELFRVTPEHAIFLVCVILALVARFSALSLGYSIDDYGLFNATDTSAADALNVAQGRFGAVALSWLFTFLGIQPPREFVLGAVLSIVALSWLAVAAVKKAGLLREKYTGAIAALIVVLHPYQVEYFTFRYSVLYLSANFALAALAFTIIGPSIKRCLLGTLVLLYGASFSPLIVILFVGATLFAAMCRFAGSSETSITERARIAVRDSLLVPNIASAAIATALFLILFLGYVHFHHAARQDSRTDLLTLSQIPQRIAQVRGSLGQVLLGNEPIFSRGPKLVILGMLLLSGLIALGSLLFRGRLSAIIPIILSTTVLPLGLLVVAYGAVLPSRVWWPVPRTLIGTVWFWAFLAVCSVRWLHSYAGRRAAIATSALFGLVVLAMISINDQVLTDQLRVNARDQHRMNRIIARLEGSPEFAQVSKLVIIGGSWAYQNAIPTAQGDMNISAIYPQWSKVALASEVSGYRFQPIYGPSDTTASQKACEHSEKWPAMDSTHIVGSIAIVCMN
jgi:hypothetical protein